MSHFFILMSIVLVDCSTDVMEFLCWRRNYHQELYRGIEGTDTMVTNLTLIHFNPAELYLLFYIYIYAKTESLLNKKLI